MLDTSSSTRSSSNMSGNNTFREQIGHDLDSLILRHTNARLDENSSESLHSIPKDYHHDHVDADDDDNRRSLSLLSRSPGLTMVREEIPISGDDSIDGVDFGDAILSDHHRTIAGSNQPRTTSSQLRGSHRKSHGSSQSGSYDDVTAERRRSSTGRRSTRRNSHFLRNVIPPNRMFRSSKPPVRNSLRSDHDRSSSIGNSKNLDHSDNDQSDANLGIFNFITNPINFIMGGGGTSDINNDDLHNSQLLNAEDNQSWFDDDDIDDDDDEYEDIRKQHQLSKEEILLYKQSDEYRISKSVTIVTRNVSILLTMCGIVCCLCIAILSPRSENDRIANAFDMAVDQLFSHSTSYVSQQLYIPLIQLSTSLTAYSISQQQQQQLQLQNTNNVYNRSLFDDTNHVWPYVTDPQFWLSSLYSTIIMNVSSIYTTPIVWNVSTWNQYTNNMISSGLLPNIQDRNTTFLYEIDPITGAQVNVLDTNEGSNNAYYPAWQITSKPANGSSNVTMYSGVNFNVKSIPSIGHALEYTTTLLPDGTHGEGNSIISAIVPQNKYEANITQHLQMFNGCATNQTQLVAGPCSIFSVPLYNNISSSATTMIKEPVGVISSPFLWGSLMTNLYPTQIMGIVVVLQATCSITTNQTTSITTMNTSQSTYYSYMINGNAVKYLGIGDKHQKYYTSYGRSMNLNYNVQQYIEQMIQINPSLSSNNDLISSFDETYCPFILHAYPSANFANLFYTNLPVVFTGTCILLWTVVLLIFMMYGAYFEQKLQILIDKASHHRHIVNTLFPKEVQDRMRELANGNDPERFFDAFNDGRLIDDDDDRHGRSKGSMHHNDDPLLQIKGFLHDQESGNMFDTPPIADLFQSATVMFADIAGFTSWSSGRNPVEVFTLLETLYKSFDNNNAKFHVFKVETIGDCYMCVTGLPEPRDDHAVMMALFSCQCIRNIRKVLTELSVKLGNDCLDLNMRTGMHSGPVTAGVLRGEKSRFQLFGDTVNTASRMESTGEKGRIQISDATAMELQRFDKSNWYRERVGGVEAKGKGIMKTHWLIPSQTKINNSTTGSKGDGGSEPDHDVSVMDDTSMRDASSQGIKVQQASTQFFPPLPTSSEHKFNRKGSGMFRASSINQSIQMNPTIYEQEHNSFSSEFEL